jgi:peptide/nickel transport system permease protein
MAVTLLVAVSMATFALVFASGDLATNLAGESGTPEDVARIRELYGLNKPFVLQYWNWFSAFARGDLGHSLYFDQPVATLIWQRLPTTLMLGVLGMSLSLAISLPLGVWAARRPGGLVDRSVILISMIGQSLPTFWVALVLIITFSVYVPVLPSSGLTSAASWVLPVVVLSLYSIPELVRLTRSGMITALGSDYIRTAKAMGLSRPRIDFVYALRNAIIPILGLAAAQFGGLLTGSVVVESIFAIPGAGRLAWESLLRTDLPTVQALILCFSAIYIALIVLADVLSALLDPRIRAAH